MYQSEIQALLEDWLGKSTDIASLHTCTLERRRKHFEDTSTLLSEVSGLHRDVFGGAYNTHSTELTTGIINRLAMMGDYPMGLRFCRAFTKKVRRGGNRLVLAKLLNHQGTMHLRLGQNELARAHYQEAHDLWSQEGEEGQVVAAMVRMNLGNTAGFMEDYELSQQHYREALKQIEAVPQSWYEQCKDQRLHPNYCQTIILGNMGYTQLVAGTKEQDPDRARQLHLQARDLLQRALALESGTVLDDRQEAFQALNDVFLGDLEQAGRKLDELKLRAIREDKARDMLGLVMFHQVELAMAEGRWDEAHQLCHEALNVSLDTGDIQTEVQVTAIYLRILGQLIDNLVSRSPEGPVVVLESSQGQQLLQGVTGLLGNKDDYLDTHHSNRVGTLARALGEALVESGKARQGPLPKSEAEAHDLIHLDFLHLAGLLHDIGKLRVPWSILNLPGEPVQEEWDILHKHALESEKILKELGLPIMGIVAAEHHENPSGIGYPHGKTSPSLMGSVLAVADGFEAATGHGAGWRASKDREQAIWDIKEKAGHLYHPDVAEVLESALAAVPD